MAVTTFMPSIWEARLLEKYHNSSIVGLITRKPTKVEGKEAIFNNVGAVAIKDYTGTVSWDELATTDIKLPYNQEKYWAFKLDDVDAVQSANGGALIDQHVAEAVATLKETVDSYVLAEAVAGVHADNVIGSSGVKTSVSKTTAYDYIVDLLTKLDKKRVPKAERSIVVSSDYLSLLEKDARFTSNYTVVENGLVEGGRINGASIIMSEDLPTSTVVALHKPTALGFGMMLEKTEAMRLEGAFADGVRGLSNYGAKTLKPEGIAVLYYTISA